MLTPFFWFYVIVVVVVVVVLLWWWFWCWGRAWYGDRIGNHVSNTVLVNKLYFCVVKKSAFVFFVCLSLCFFNWSLHLKTHLGLDGTMLQQKVQAMLFKAYWLIYSLLEYTRVRNVVLFTCLEPIIQRRSILYNPTMIRCSKFVSTVAL